MFFPPIAFLCLAPFLLLTCTNAASQTTAYPASSSNIVNLRIEGDNTTYFEGPIKSGPRNISINIIDTNAVQGSPLLDTDLAQGPKPPFPCDGLNLGANPKPGNTPTCALDAAAKAKGFTYDGSSDADLEDYYVTRISTSDANNFLNKFWGVTVNYKVSTFPEGITLSGCQQEVNAGDEVLWAFITLPPGTNDDSKVPFLKLVPTAVTVKKGKGFMVTVTNGRTGLPVKDASVDGVHTDANGKATLYLFNAGFFQYKAHQTGSVRSNVMNVTVTS